MEEETPPPIKEDLPSNPSTGSSIPVNSSEQLDITETAPPYLYISSFSELKSKNDIIDDIPAKEKSKESIKGPKIKPHFLCQLPSPFTILEESGESWILRCVCNEHSNAGFLVCCDTCSHWQHGICVNLNPHTIPDRYQCEKCGNRPIRCKCNDPLNYRFSIIECSNCHYYFHRRCAGFFYGPLPVGDFICSFCGKSHFHPRHIPFPSSLSIPKSTFHFTNEFLETLPNSFLTGPFGDILNDFSDSNSGPISVQEFTEKIYNSLRSFFYIYHPLYTTSLSKKKRMRLLSSFLSTLEYFYHNQFHLDHSQFVTIIDAMINADLYVHDTIQISDEQIEQGLDFTENARFELPPLQLQTFSVCPQTVELNVVSNSKDNSENTSNDNHDTSNSENASTDNNDTEDAIVCNSHLNPEQLICTLEGLVGDLEEWVYDSGVTDTIYQIRDTRLVLDISRVNNSPLRHIPRSIEGNCVIRLFRVGESILCGLFASGIYLMPGAELSFNGISPGTPLKIGIDFIPGVITEPTKWLSWRTEIQEEKEREKPEKDKKGEKKDKRMKKRKNMTKKKNEASNQDFSLFSLLSSESPGPYLFNVSNFQSSPYVSQSNSSSNIDGLYNGANSDQNGLLDEFNLSNLKHDSNESQNMSYPFNNSMYQNSSQITPLYMMSKKMQSEVAEYDHRRDLSDDEDTEIEREETKPKTRRGHGMKSLSRGRGRGREKVHLFLDEKEDEREDANNGESIETESEDNMNDNINDNITDNINESDKRNGKEKDKKNLVNPVKQNEKENNEPSWFSFEMNPDFENELKNDQIKDFKPLVIPNPISQLRGMFGL